MWIFLALKPKQLLPDHWQGVRVSRGLLQALPSSQAGLVLALPLPTHCIRDALGEQPASDDQVGEKPLSSSQISSEAPALRLWQLLRGEGKWGSLPLLFQPPLSPDPGTSHKETPPEAAPWYEALRGQNKPPT